MCIILPAESDLSIGEVYEPMVGNGDAMGCSGPDNEGRASDRRRVVWRTRPSRAGRANEERNGMPVPAQVAEGFQERLTVVSEKLSSTLL